MAVRHLHRDYSTSHCGKDISHLLATFDENEATCKACKTDLVRHREEEEAARIEEQRRDAEEAAERQAKDAALRRQQEDAIEDRELSRLKMERELGLRE